MASLADPISAAIGGAFNYAGSKAQAGVAQNALDYEKSIKAKQMTAAQPYLSLGQLAVSRLPGAVSPGPVTFGAQPMSSMGSQMVTVQAPTGETRQMSPAQAQQFVQRGARIVG